MTTTAPANPSSSTEIPTIDHWIDGKRVAGTSGRTSPVFDPALGIATKNVALASQQEIDAAIASAKAAFPKWRDLSITKRQQIMFRFRELVNERKGELAEILTAEHGKVISDSLGEIQRGLEVLELATGFPHIIKGDFSQQVSTGVDVYSTKSPLGVVGIISPFNFPVMVPMWFFPIAIAAGNTVVLKPSEITPLTAFLLADAADEAGLPAGVLNVVCGTGRSVGEHLVASPLVDLVSFTGSTRAGRRISELASERVKPTMMELGGKSPSVLLDDLVDAEFDRAVESTVRNCYENAGQTCTALTRLIVPAGRRDRAEQVAVALVAGMRVGGPEDGADLGPLISSTQRDRVAAFVDEAIADGARVLIGGGVVDGPGTFFAPTVISDVRPTMRIAREEVFGPVLVIETASDDTEAIAIANDTDYGLAAAVWGADPERTRAAARAIAAGWVTVNGAEPDGDLPFGGVKQSGHGREAGVPGVMEYLTMKVMTA